MTQQTASPASRIAAAPGDPAATAIPRVALVGVHGFGERHLANLARLTEDGVVELVAVADPNPPQEGALGGLCGGLQHPGRAAGSRPGP